MNTIAAQKRIIDYHAPIVEKAKMVVKTECKKLIRNIMMIGGLQDHEIIDDELNISQSPDD